MRWQRLVLGAAVSAAVGAGCNGKGNPGAESSDDLGSAIEDADPVPEGEAPQRVARDLCEFIAGCDCEMPIGRAECERMVEDASRTALDNASAQGLSLDEECLGKMLATYDVVDCSTLQTDPSLLEDVLFDLIETYIETGLYKCKLLYGTDMAGETCTQQQVEDGFVFSGDSCGRGLRCLEDVCRVIPDTAAAGEPCSDEIYFTFYSCEIGTQCIDVEDTGDPRCVTLPEAGQPCLGASQRCDSDSSCVEGTCVADPGLGQPCEFTCIDQLVCDDASSTCVPPAALGESCATRRCAFNLQCDEATQTCIDDPDDDLCNLEGVIGPGM